MGNCFHCYKNAEYAEHIENIENIEKNENIENIENIEKNEKNEKNEKIENEFDNPKIDFDAPPKIELERTQSVDINIILNQIIDTYNQQHPKLPTSPKTEKKEPEIVFTVKRMNCRINI